MPSRGYSNHHIESKTLAEFHRAYVFNRRRRRLMVALLDELAGIAEQTTKLRVMVFGSFITDKPEPGDIDALVSTVARKECFREVQENGYPRRRPEEVDLFTYLSVRFLFSPEKMFEEFNHNFKNRENQIILKEGVLITDIDAYRERMKKGFRSGR